MKIIKLFLLMGALFFCNATFSQQRNPSARALLNDKVMQDSIMMTIARDPQLMHKMMETMMSRAEKDTTMCKSMMSMMMNNQNMHQKMMEMMHGNSMKEKMKEEHKE